KSYKKWDVALNKAYKALMKRLPEQDKLLLRESQRKWISYRDSEFVFMQKHIRREGGTLSLIIVDERMANFVRRRVIALEAYNFILDFPP
ncbi:MAG: lysozyme inhibitor LprI family protein, partial [Acidiferrobacterales bacterium]